VADLFGTLPRYPGTPLCDIEMKEQDVNLL
jgi:hypothetical protein